MLVNVNYTKEANACRDCPYYFEDHDMGARIPICSKRTGNIILSNPNMIPSDCPIKEDKLRRDASKILYQMYQDALDEIQDIKFSDFPIGMNEEILREEYDKKLKKFKSILMNLDDMC